VVISALALSLLLSAAPPEPRRPRDWTTFTIPALESAALNLGLLSFSNLVTRMEFALVTRESIEQNLRPSSWTFDVDYYVTNQFGHPYTGAWYFQAARSAGLDFWWSALYSTVFSLAWELFFELEPPSVNDQITTPMGGAMLGEVLHRSALYLRRSPDGPRWLNVALATVLDPFGALNYALLGEPTALEDPLAPMFARWQVGAIASRVVDRTDLIPRELAPVQAVIALHVVSGAPWDEHSRFDLPLSYFDLRADFAFPLKPTGNLFIRGLLVGTRLGAPRGRVRGAWGLMGQYDYAAPAALVRASAVGLGPGFSAQWEPGANWYLQGGGVLGLSPMAAAGQILEVSPHEGRDYHVGPGLQSMAELRLFRPHTLLVELVVRHWLVIGAYAAPTGYESITYVTAAAHVPVWRWLGLGAEVTLSDRRASLAFYGSEHDTGLTGRLVLSILSDQRFGVRGTRAQTSR
jgi:hypothetical protein